MLNVALFRNEGTAAWCVPAGPGAVQASGVGVCPPECQLQRAVQAQAEQAGHRRPCERMGRSALAHSSWPQAKRSDQQGRVLNLQAFTLQCILVQLTRCCSATAAVYNKLSPLTVSLHTVAVAGVFEPVAIEHIVFRLMAYQSSYHCIIEVVSFVHRSICTVCVCAQHRHGSKPLGTSCMVERRVEFCRWHLVTTWFTPIVLIIS